MNRSLKDTLKVTALLAPVAVDADVNSAGVSVVAGEALQLAVSVGDFTFTGTNKLSLRLEHSDDDSTYAAVADADAYETIGANGEFKELNVAGDADSVTLVNYAGTKPYVRVAIVEAGTVDVPAAVYALQGHLKAQGE